MTMRRFIDIIREAEVRDMSPEKYEAGDADHYVARDETGFFGRQAAGAIVMAKSTGRLLFMLRSDEVEEPGTWGNCGGAFHIERETPEKAALREVRQETGWTGAIDLVPLYVFKKGSFRYFNFLATVEEEFAPHLGWEADGHEWRAFGDWPQPLHFGLQALFRDTDSVETIQAAINSALSS